MQGNVNDVPVSYHVTEGTLSMYFEFPNYTRIIWFYKVAFYQHLC